MGELLIDVTRLLGRSWKGRLPTGIDRVVLAYIRHFGERARAVVCLGGGYFVLPRRSSLALYRWLQEPRGRAGLARILAGALVSGWRSQAVAGLPFLHAGHSGLERSDYPDMLERMGVCPVIFVHDLIPISHPEFCRAGERERHIARMGCALRCAAAIIANSRATLDALHSFAERMPQPMPRAVVAWLAPDLPTVPAGVRTMAQPYFVILGTIEPRKNHEFLLLIWRRLVESMGESAPRLVVIGQRGWECEGATHLLDRCEQLKGYVFELSHCTDAQLTAYLQSAQALLLPSFAEGYGLPLVEALALGVPVIASELPAFREVAGDIPEYADPLDGKRWAELIRDFAGPQSALRERQVARLKDFRIPTWSAHFAAVDALLELVCP
jgi:glycosyltransferase involved in cell wall biosynthesis